MRKNKFTRKDIILNVANKDGGAHVDPTLPEMYYELSRKNSIGWKLITDETVMDFSVGPELASIRQIAYEIIVTLEKDFPFLKSL